MNIDTPQYFKISNEYKEVGNTTQCNPFNKSNNFGNYFQKCSQDSRSALWGSHKPAPDRCDINYKPHSGQPCTSIWNNLTKRKSVVDYTRGEIVKNISVPPMHRLPPDLEPAMLIPPEREESLKVASKTCNCSCYG